MNQLRKLQGSEENRLFRPIPTICLEKARAIRYHTLFVVHFESSVTSVTHR